MENTIVVIAAIAFFIYNTYANYKKEQEKSRTRNPGSPNQPAIEDKPASDFEKTTMPNDMPNWLEQFFPSEELEKTTPQVAGRSITQPAQEIAHQGSIDYQPVKYERVKYVPSELPADLLKEYRNLPDKLEIDEVKRSTAIHLSHGHEFKRLKPFLLDEQVVEEIEVPSFNLREAIIMQAILERPYR